MPSTSAPRSRSSRAITSTSLMRGTLVSTHSSVGEQARGEQRQRGVLVAFDVDAARQRGGRLQSAVSTLRASSRQPRSRRGRRSRRAARRRSASRTLAWQRSISARMSPRVAPPSLTMKLPCVGETRAPPIARALQPRAIDQRAGRPRECRPAPRRGRDPDSGRCSPALGDVERLRPLPERQRLARDRAQRRRLARRDTRRPPTAAISPVRCSRLRS